MCKLIRESNAKKNKKQNTETQTVQNIVISCTPFKLTCIHVGLLAAFTYLPLAQCTVFCNEFDTCFPLEKQVNVSDAIREGNKGQVCK